MKTLFDNLMGILTHIIYTVLMLLTAYILAKLVLL